MIRERKLRFYNRECEKLATPGANKTAYKALRSIADAERAKPWTIKAIRLISTDKDIAEELADYFAAISQTFDPLDRDLVPITFDRPVPTLAKATVEARLSKMKKPSSAVTIDPIPCMINLHTDIYADILTPIYQTILEGERWPLTWASEEVSVIPKTSFPDSLDQCRNISCTSVFSNLGESFMLDSLVKEIRPDDNQFGGFKGSGTVHLLTELVTSTMACLDDNRAASTLISIDLSKAFNHMDHRLCLLA